MNRLSGLLALPALVLMLSSCQSTDWPQYRGPDANPVVSSAALPVHWGADQHLRWSYELNGEGWSSPVISGNGVFVTTVVRTDEGQAAPETPPGPPPQRGDAPPAPAGNPSSPPPPPPAPEEPGFLKESYRWEVICVDLETGEERWRKIAREGAPRIPRHRMHTYAGESPVTDGKYLFVYFGMTGLYCYDLEGELKWEKDLGVFETLHDWGTGSSPVLYKDLLIIQVDNEEQSFLVALNKGDGEEVWRVDRDEKMTYNTPFIWKNDVRTELVTGGKTARSYDPETGDLLWEMKMGGYYSIPSPVADAQHIYIGNTKFRQTAGELFAVRAGASGLLEPGSEYVTWSLDDAPLENPSPVLKDGLIYTISSRGGMVSCLDASDGSLVYQEKITGVGACWTSPWINGDELYFMDEKGKTQVIGTGREFEWLHENVLDDKFWSSPGITPDAYLFRGTDRLYCVGK